MEVNPQNQNIVPPADIPAQATEQPTAVPGTPVAESSPTPKNLINKLKEKLASFKFKPAEMPKPKISKKVIIIIAVVLLLLVLLVIVSKVMNLTGGNGTVPVATGSPISEPTAEAEVPSQYADDADVAEIRSAMEQLDKDLNDANFREDRLRVPALDWNVEFD